MSTNRIHYFIRNILQNSKLNREKFVNNKKKYNMTTVKNRNHNMIIKRNFGSYTDFMPPKKNPDNNEIKYAIIAMIVGSYFVSKKN
jgi:hypothetical protein